MKKLKIFGKGFLKGLGISLILLILLNILERSVFHVPEGVFFSAPFFIIFIIGFIVGSFFVIKYKQPQAWLALILIFNIYMLPFLFGAIEYSKNYKD